MAIHGYDHNNEEKESALHTAGKVFGYFFGTVIIVVGLFLLVAAMQVTIFHGLFMLIMSIAVFVGGGLFLRWVHRK